MARYRYSALSAKGERIEGDIDAESWEDAVSRIRARGEIAVSASPAGLEALEAGGSPATGAPTRRKAPNALIANWTDQLATLLEADLPVDEALSIIADADAKRRARFPFHAKIQDDVRAGRLLSRAIEDASPAFPGFYSALLAAGEAAGDAPGALRQLATLLSRSLEMRERLRSAFVYPIFLVVMSALSIGVVLGVVVPALTPLFATAGDALPTSTRVVIAASELMRAHGWTILGVVSATVLSLVAIYRSRRLRPAIDRLNLSVPIIGGVLGKAEAARLLRTLGMLLRNGVAPLAALQTARLAAQNTVYRNEMARLVEATRAGGNLASEIGRGGLFPDTAARMALVGDRAGRMSEMLIKGGDLLEKEAMRQSERAMGLITPALTVFMGLVIGAVALSLVSAILSVNNAVY